MGVSTGVLAANGLCFTCSVVSLSPAYVGRFHEEYDMSLYMNFGIS